MDEERLPLAILRVEEREVFWSVVYMSAGFCDRNARVESPGSDLWVPVIRGGLMVSRDRRKVHRLKETAGGPVGLTWFGQHYWMLMLNS